MWCPIYIYELISNQYTDRHCGSATGIIRGAIVA